MLEKLLSILGFEFIENNEEIKLDDKIYIRVNANEKILIQKYATLKGTDVSKLLRGLVLNDIDRFIKNSR